MVSYQGMGWSRFKFENKSNSSGSLFVVLHLGLLLLFLKLLILCLELLLFECWSHLLELLLVVVKSKFFSPSASMAFHVVINRLLTSRCRLDIHYSERDRHPTRPLLHVEQVSSMWTCKVSLRATSSHYAARIQNT